MIRLPVLEALVVVLRISVGLAILTALLIPTLCVLARRRWRSSRPAIWPHRLAFGSLIAALLWAVFNLPGLLPIVILLPSIISALGFAYIAWGNRRRGHPNPRLLVPAVSAVAFTVAALFALGLGMRAHHAAVEAEEAERRAEGRRAQDFFNALVRIDDETIVVVGTTSSEPCDADDVWVHTIDADGGLLDAVTYERPGDQVGMTLAPGPDGSWILGGRDDDHPFLAHASPEGIAHYDRWDSPGSLHVLHAIGDARFVAGGQAVDKAWIGVIDDSGGEEWRADLDTGITNATVIAIAAAKERFVAVGSDYIFSSGAFLVGGTLAGRIDWTKPLHAASGATIALTQVRARPDGTYVALGHRSQAGKMEDLWIVQVSRDGTLLKELTLGDAPSEYSGGLALRGDDLIVAGHRFTAPDSSLWLLSASLDGEVKWEKTYPNSRFGRAADVAALPGGDILVVGHRRPESKSDAWISRFDRNGNPLWQRTYPAQDDSIAARADRRGG